MGLINRFFGTPKEKEAAGPESVAPSTQFHESEASTGDQPPSRNVIKRELVQVLLRDTMRKHGIPSDWVDCRLLTTTSRTGRLGLHAQFIVKQSHERLLNYVFAFQDSFQRELSRLEPRYADWLLSISWQFDGYLTPKKSAMPDPKVWVGGAHDHGHAPATVSAPAALAAPVAAPDAIPFAPTQDPEEDEDDVQRDLAALFKIRDAALAETKPPGDPTGFEETRPGGDEPDLPPR